MAFYCIDYNNGSDTTGDGTASAPWATVAHAETQINAGAGYIAGDEMRIAGSTLSASLGTVQWASATTSAFSVSTDADYTASISAGDYLVIGTTADAGAMPLPLKVNTITSTSISFYAGYINAMYAGVSYNIYKVSDFVAFNVTGFSTILDNFNTQSQNSFTAFSDTITISGGWDPANFTSKTAYGKTAFVREGTYNPTSGLVYGYVFQPPSTAGSNGFLFKDFDLSRTYLYRYASTSLQSGHNYDGIAAAYRMESAYQMPNGTRSIKNFINLSPGHITFAAGLSTTNILYDFDGNRLGLNGNTSTPSDRFTPLGTTYDDRVNNITNTDVYFFDHSSNPSFLYSSYMGYDPTTINIFKENPNTVVTFSSSGFDSQFDPTPFILNDTFIGNFNKLFGGTCQAVNFQIGNINNMPDLITAGSQGSTYDGPYNSDFKVTETSTGTVYTIMGMAGGAQLNTTDNATGNNCIQLTPFASENIVSNLTKVSAKPGDTVTIDISAKILGTDTSCVPSLNMFLNFSSMYTSRVGQQSSSSRKFALTKSAGTSFNNTAYSTLTYSGTVAAYSTYTDNSYYITTVLDTGSDITSGNSLLIDSITVTVS